MRASLWGMWGRTVGQRVGHQPGAQETEPGRFPGD